MRWIRLNQRIGAWAALFALAVQITLSFGHVHAPKIALPSHAAQWQTAGGGTPANPKHPADADDFCAICATIAMVASAALPETAPLPPPVATPYAWAQNFIATLSWRQTHSPFQARGPPFIG